MKPKAVSVTHVSFAGDLLPTGAREEILRIVEARFPNEAALRFLASVNGAIVHAYKLAPRLSTGGERREWFVKVSKALNRLLAILREADGSSSEAVSEDLERLDRILCDYFGRESGPRADSLMVPVLQKLADETDAQTRKLSGSKKSTGPRQQLANQLALAWNTHLGERPTSSHSVNRDGSESCSPFIKVLRAAIESVDAGQLTDKSLRQMTERAIRWLNRQ